MNNLLAAEQMKLRHNKLILACSLLAIILPVMIISIDIFHGATPKYTVTGWIYRLASLCQYFAYPVLSGFVLTFLIQREYIDHTIINMLTAPVSRTRLLIGKLIIWATWHIAMTICYLAIVCSGVDILYGSATLYGSFYEITGFIIKFGLFHLATLTPIAWVAVLQRKNFYPSLLCTIIFTGIGFAGLYLPKLLGSLLPWSAVPLITVPGMQVIPELGITSISICTLFGLFMTIYSFKHQDQ